MNTLPTVSVIIAVKNGAAQLAATLESVTTAQTYPPLEVLIVDDQSEDATRAIAESFAAQGVRFIANPVALGIAGSRNLGVELARGELLAFNSHDDLWDPAKLRLQAGFLAAHPEIACCLCHVRCFTDPGQAPPRNLPRAQIDVPMPGYLPETLLARRAAFARVGPFDTTLKQADDTDWFARAQDLGLPFAMLPECLVQKRLHPASTTHRPGQSGRLQRELLQVVRRSLVRKRARPRISVIVPVRDGARYLGEALESILAQTCPAAEIWVVDDGSTDDSAGVAARFAERGVRWVSQPAAGAAAARNHGVSLATGDLLAFLDADDLWSADKLARQSAALAADPGLDLVFGHLEQFVSPDLDEVARAGLACPPGRAPGYLPSALLLRRTAWERVGPFETRWEIGEFIAWTARARELGLRECLLDAVLLRRRLHAANQGRQKRAHYRDYALILKALLDRRRQAAVAPVP